IGEACLGSGSRGPERFSAGCVHESDSSRQPLVFGLRCTLRDAAHVGIRHALHRSPQTQRPTVGGHPSKGNPALAVRGQLDDRTGSTVSRLSCVLHESTRTSSFLVQDFVRTPKPPETYSATSPE